VTSQFSHSPLAIATAAKRNGFVVGAGNTGYGNAGGNG